MTIFPRKMNQSRKTITSHNTNTIQYVKMKTKVMGSKQQNGDQRKQKHYNEIDGYFALKA